MSKLDILLPDSLKLFSEGTTELILIWADFGVEGP